ncbi:MAG: AmmeMemoRadiSam system radical SAM enzyme [Chlorobi bacterium]|nr:AmmeMemoRadiSam system radical SAM enzyme [Chlorobiota bacterium]
MKEAAFYIKLDSGKTQCLLCPHECKINVGKRGICHVRKNVEGKLVSENYGQVCSLHFDPIEKKPLYHFYPGSTVFSVGSVGCNLHCRFCQNCEISQTSVGDFPFLKEYPASEIVRLAMQRKDNIGIAYTYNEPIVWYEFMLDVAKLAQNDGLKNVMVTNGFINPGPLKELMPLMDAFSVDLKAFDDGFYRKITSSRLAPVLETLNTLRRYDKHFEITNLVITAENDNEKEFADMVKWISGELGKETVLHISRYHPMYKMTNPATSVHKLMDFFRIAKEKLDFVYVGNVLTKEGQNTYCPECGHLLVERLGYSVDKTGLDEDGSCGKCGATVFNN